jgi:hypothetical protein
MFSYLHNIDNIGVLSATDQLPINAQIMSKEAWEKMHDKDDRKCFGGSMFSPSTNTFSQGGVAKFG